MRTRRHGNVTWHRSIIKNEKGRTKKKPNDAFSARSLSLARSISLALPISPSRSPPSLFLEYASSYAYSLGVITSSIFKIIRTSCVARRICCFFPINVSNTRCFFMSIVPFCRQSMPR